MAQYGPPRTAQDAQDVSGMASGTERGTRRKKLAGYLKAANDLRQTYQQQYLGSREQDEEDLPAIPGSFPDVATSTHGDEQLILFPSYCKRHTRDEPRLPSERSAQEKEAANQAGIGDADFWKREWDKFESDKAIVDVDVRGWVYSPHRGPMSRKNRLLVGLARQLSGVSATPRRPDLESRNSSTSLPSLRRHHEEHEARRDQESIDVEADAILKKGAYEGRLASQGAYSEAPEEHNSKSGNGVSGEHADASFVADAGTRPPRPGALKPSVSWNQPADMSPEEMAAANTNLMTRLMPFLTTPLVSTPITIFFYDEHTSQSKTVVTNEAGHFNIRAALEFLPTHVRVLASEHLSATEEVRIMDPLGISVISDVDDTIKHSSISAGAREIFRNAFIRDLSDLTIKGVKEWYTTMFDMGVGFHYVSNSPWQLFPVLVSYFQIAGLPSGSYHLKNYSGMLQGIFEPVAERKKGTLERIMHDFPQRKFLLIGDSGEADLEVYTDVVLANPGRIIGVFIRDVTTPKLNFFDASGLDIRLSKLSSGDNADDDSHSANLKSDLPSARPRIPDRIESETKAQTSAGPAMGKLIDLDDESELVHEPKSRVLPRSNSDLALLTSQHKTTEPMKTKAAAPPPPSKPAALRGLNARPTAKDDSALVRASNDHGPPALPRPRTSRNETSSSSHPLKQTSNTSDSNSNGYLAAARYKVASAYNALPPAAAFIPGMSATDQSSVSARPLPELRPPPPPPPPRRAAMPSSTPSFAASIKKRASWASSAEHDGDSDLPSTSAPSSGSATPSQQPVNKKVELWLRRWQRAQDILSSKGVELRAWRVGEDIAAEAVRLVKENMRVMGLEDGKPGAATKGRSAVAGGGEHKVKDLKR